MPAPRLAGLSYEYLVAAMRAFAKDERTNNLDMPGLMRALPERERNAIARYVSTL
jgi:cytochrome c553